MVAAGDIKGRSCTFKIFPRLRKEKSEITKEVKHLENLSLSSMTLGISGDTEVLVLQAFWEL